MSVGNDCVHISRSLSSLQGGYIGDYIGTTIGVIKGFTRSLDNGSYAAAPATRERFKKPFLKPRAVCS